MKWFKHFTKSLSDAKIEKLIMRYGIEGYGLYFACLEIIAGNLSDENITFELEHDAEILAHKFKLDQLKTQEMMLYMVNLGLFELNPNTNLVSCMKLAQYIDSSLIKNPELLKVKKYIQEDSRKLEIVQENSSQIRLDKIRLEENRDKENATPDKQAIPKKKKAVRERGELVKYNDFVFLSDIEYKELLDKYGFDYIDRMIFNLNCYIGQLGHDKYKDHYLTILAWIKKDEKNGNVPLPSAPKKPGMTQEEFWANEPVE